MTTYTSRVNETLKLSEAITLEDPNKKQDGHFAHTKDYFGESLPSPYKPTSNYFLCGLWCEQPFFMGCL